MQGFRIRWMFLGILVVALTACSPKPVLRQPPKPTANPETSYKLVTPPDAPHYNLKPGQSATRPQPLIGRFAPPVYPAALAHPGMPPVLVKAQLVFDSDGEVREVVILSDSYTGTRQALFEDAVRDAVQDWAFTPLVFEQSVGGGSTPITVKRQARPFSLWFEFRFKMVDGKPSTAVKRRPDQR